MKYREHDLSADCWCKPERLPEGPYLVERDDLGEYHVHSWVEGQRGDGPTIKAAVDEALS